MNDLKKKQTVPLIKYDGGKYWEFKKFSRYIPKHFRTYYEPFAGALGVYFRLQPKRAILSDINQDLICFYQDLVANYRDVKQEVLELAKQYHRYGKRNYYRLRKMLNGEAKKQYHFATIYYYINHTAFNGMIRYNRHGGFNVPFGGYRRLTLSPLKDVTVKLLSTAKIERCSYEKPFRMAKAGDFMFLDPPYPAKKGSKFVLSYGNPKPFDTNEQIKLAKRFKRLKCQALLILPKTKVISELYNGYVVGEYGKQYSSKFKNRSNSSAEHLIIMNRQ